MKPRRVWNSRLHCIPPHGDTTCMHRDTIPTLSDRLHLTVLELGLCFSRQALMTRGGNRSSVLPPWYRRSRGHSSYTRQSLSTLHERYIHASSLSVLQTGEKFQPMNPKRKALLGCFSFQISWVKPPFLRFLWNPFHKILKIQLVMKIKVSWHIAQNKASLPLCQSWRD